MKFRAAVSLCLLGYVAAGRPSLSISVKGGEFDDLDALDPILAWSGESSAGDFDLSYGVKAHVRATKEVASLPKSIWGKASTVLSGWGVSVRGEVKEGSLNTANLDVELTNEDADVAMSVSGSTGKSTNAVQTVTLTKGLNVGGARVLVNPGYDLERREPDLFLSYNKDDTTVELTADRKEQEVYLAQQVGSTNTKVEIVASLDSQEVTITQKLDDDNSIAPSVSSNGDIAIEWKRSLGEGKSVTATLKPNDKVTVEWKDDAWKAKFNVPMDGTEILGTTVDIERAVSF